MGSEGEHSKDPHMRHFGVARFIQVEICPWVSNVPFPWVPPWKKSNRVFSRANTKASFQSSCVILKLSSLDPSSCQTCMAVWSPARNNAQMRGASARLQARESARMHGVSVASWVGEYERASLFHWDYINVGLEWTRCFIKITNQLPKIL